MPQLFADDQAGDVLESVHGLRAAADQDAEVVAVNFNHNQALVVLICRLYVACGNRCPDPHFIQKLADPGA